MPYWNGRPSQLLDVMLINYSMSDLKSLGACPRDGSSPSSGTRNYWFLCHRFEVAFLFENYECGTFAGLFSADLIGCRYQIFRLRLRIMGCSSS